MNNIAQDTKLRTQLLCLKLKMNKGEYKYISSLRNSFNTRKSLYFNYLKKQKVNFIQPKLK